MKPLDPWQLALRGTSLIEASAGTGKTHTLTTLYLRLLVEAELTPAQILVVTYTEAATAELRARVRERIQQAIAAGEASETEEVDEALRALALRARRRAEQGRGADPLRQALQSFDEAAIFTIHGFCQRTLQENAFESGIAFDAELVEKSEPLQRILAHDLWANLLREESPDFVAWLREGAGRPWDFEPGALEHQLLDKLGADEEMPVLPASEAAASEDAGRDPAALQAEVAEAWRRWAESWHARRESVEALLCGKHDLNKNSYPVAKIARDWLPSLDELARDVEREDQQGRLVAPVRPDFWDRLLPSMLAKRLNKGGKPVEDAFFEVCAQVEAAVAALDAAQHARALALRRRFVEQARAAARRRREQQHLLFFDDLLSELRAALRSDARDRLIALLRDRYRFALIDEFQDTDPVQYEIFRSVWHRDAEPDAESELGRGLVLIGDPKQAIYSFRGADVFTYLRARDDAGEHKYSLSVNWRSDPGLISAVNALFERPADVFGLKGIGFEPARPRPGAAPRLDAPGRSEAGLRVLLTDLEAGRSLLGEPELKKLRVGFGRVHLMRAMATDMADLLESGATIEGRPLRPSDIAVLCRRNRELGEARRALEAVGIPCVDRGDANVFDAREAWELASLMRAWLRPGDPRTLRGALSSGAHGLDSAALAALADDSLELSQISERFADYGRIWSQSGFARAFESWRRGEGVTARLLAYSDGDRRLTNWLHLAELLQTRATDRGVSRTALVGWLETAIETPELRDGAGADASLLRLERDDEAVSLVTLHRSKGLQYPIVYLPSLWESASPRLPADKAVSDASRPRPALRFHHAEHGRSFDLGCPGEDYLAHLAQAREEELSEQIRLLYVASTRAKHQCVLTWGPIGDGYRGTPMAWLLHAPSFQTEGVLRETSAQQLKGLDDGQWRAAWQALADAAEPGAVHIEVAKLAPRDRWVTASATPPPLSFRAATRVPSAPVRTTSFSAIVRDATSGLASYSLPEITGRDLDAGVDAERAGREASDADPDLAADMHLFPRGAAAGTALHEVLERIDPAHFESEQIRDLARQSISRNALDASCEGQFLHVVEAVARTPLRHRPEPFRLADLAPGRLLPEMEFTLAASAGSEAAGFDGAGLAALLAGAPADSPLARYADRAARLGWRTIRGYLRGFIDAVFHDGERYYLIDYKSNHLGVRQADYMPEALVAPMIEHDYVLQYLIYTIALDRYLAGSLEGYDYETHFGGAYYLFLRGLSASHGPGCGVFFDRPPGDRVRAASRLLGGEGRAAA